MCNNLTHFNFKNGRKISKLYFFSKDCDPFGLLGGPVGPHRAGSCIAKQWFQAPASETYYRGKVRTCWEYCIRSIAIVEVCSTIPRVHSLWRWTDSHSRSAAHLSDPLSTQDQLSNESWRVTGVPTNPCSSAHNLSPSYSCSAQIRSEPPSPQEHTRTSSTREKPPIQANEVAPDYQIAWAHTAALTPP